MATIEMGDILYVLDPTDGTSMFVPGAEFSSFFHPDSDALIGGWVLPGGMFVFVHTNSARSEYYRTLVDVSSETLIKQEVITRTASYVMPPLDSNMVLVCKPIIVGNTVVEQYAGGEICAFELDTGNFMWQNHEEIGGDETMVYALVYADGFLFASRSSVSGGVDNASLHKINLDTGAVVLASAPDLAYFQFYIPTIDGLVGAGASLDTGSAVCVVIDPEDLEVINEFDTDDLPSGFSKDFDFVSSYVYSPLSNSAIIFTHHDYNVWIDFTNERIEAVKTPGSGYMTPLTNGGAAIYGKGKYYIAK